jgi:nonsense-mediated mRNA decay protein 3
MVRVPEYKQGDFIELNNRIYQIKRIQSKHVVGLDLKTGGTQSFNQEALSESSLLGGSELIYDAVVVMESAREVQVLDPENYNTLDLIKPQNFQVKNETVKIFKSQDRVFLLPN